MADRTAFHLAAATCGYPEGIATVDLPLLAGATAEEPSTSWWREIRAFFTGRTTA